jgi:hypothetical protein
MQSRQHPLAFLATTLLLTLTAQSSRAIDIEGQPGLIPNNTYSLSFFPGEGVGITTLSTYDPLFPSSELHPFGEVYEIQRGGTPGLLGDLQTFIDRGWYFQTGRDLTESSFVISRYYACGVHTPCGIGAYPEPRTGGAGSVFSLNYIPRSNDPQPGSQNPLYWIQRVITNYPSSVQGSFGVRRTYIDNSGRSTPYSIGGLPLNSNGYFIDRPYRPIINGNTYNKNFYWIGELYLAEELQNTQNITIYNGVGWGWRYDFGRQVKQFFDFLSSGNEEDNFLVDNLPAGAKFYAYTNNDVPGNRCNPNTYLTASGEGGYSDDNSSPVGDGFGSALRGTVPSNGTINLRVRAANGGARGEDRGSYELSVLVFD